MQEINSPEITRGITDSPTALTLTAVKAWLIEHGAGGIISQEALADILGVQKRTIKSFEKKGVKPIDKCTYNLDDIVKVLVKNPRYLSQKRELFAVKPEHYPMVKNLIKSMAMPLLKLWNNDIDDLTAEVCYQMGRMPLSNTKVPDNIVAIRAIHIIWNQKRTNQMKKTVSLDAIQENGGQI